MTNGQEKTVSPPHRHPKNCVVLSFMLELRLRKFRDHVNKKVRYRFAKVSGRSVSPDCEFKWMWIEINSQPDRSEVEVNSNLDRCETMMKQNGFAVTQEPRLQFQRAFTTVFSNNIFFVSRYAHIICQSLVYTLPSHIHLCVCQLTRRVLKRRSKL